MTFEIEPNPPEEPQKVKQPGCVFRAITAIVIITLLASSLVSIAWFVRNRAEQSQPAAAELPTPQPTAVAQEAPSTSTAVPSQPEVAPTTAIENAHPSHNRLVMVNNEGQIETVAQDGSERRILTDAEINFQFPAWSPDGNQIAALGTNTEGAGIFLMKDSENTEDVNELFFGPGRSPFYLYWSPDSSQISFLAAQLGQQMSLNIVNAQEGGESQEIATGSPFYWDWTADSAQLLIHSGLTEDARLALIDNGGKDQDSEINAPGYFQAPGISPSGRFWAYSQLQEGGNSWLTIDNQETNETQTERHGGSLALSWSPTEDKLAYISGEDDRQTSFWGPLRLIDAETGEGRVLSSNLVLAFFWSPDGKKIVTISSPVNNNFEGEIEVRAPKSRQVAKIIDKPILPVQGRSTTFSISVINIEDGTGLELTEASLPTGFLTQFLIFFDQYALSHSIWSPESDAIVLPILGDTESILTVIKTDSGRKQSIGPGRIAFWSPQ